MLILQPPMKYTSSYHTCDYHKRHPEDRNYAGCTCSGHYGCEIKPMKDWTDEERRAYFGEHRCMTQEIT